MTKINTEYVSALEEREKIDRSWRSFQNFLLNTDTELMKKIQEPVIQIEKIISKKKDLYV